VFALGEILTGVYKTNGTKEARTIQDFFGSGAVLVFPFDLKTAGRYAELRANHDVSPAEAIHLATASLAGVDVYLTNDQGIKRLQIPGIQFIAGLDGTIF
jgi:predicted nucleic acid-binding protein